jgi:hypothetical protein
LKGNLSRNGTSGEERGIVLAQPEPRRRLRRAIKKRRRSSWLRMLMVMRPSHLIDHWMELLKANGSFALFLGDLNGRVDERSIQ